MKTNKFQPNFRPGSLSGYLREYGWEPVNVPENYPLWQKDGRPPIPASQALLEIYRAIWKQQKQQKSENPTS